MPRFIRAGEPFRTRTFYFVIHCLQGVFLLLQARKPLKLETIAEIGADSFFTLNLRQKSVEVETAAEQPGNVGAVTSDSSSFFAALYLRTTSPLPLLSAGTMTVC